MLSSASGAEPTIAIEYPAPGRTASISIWLAGLSSTTKINAGLSASSFMARLLGDEPMQPVDQFRACNRVALEDSRNVSIECSLVVWVQNFGGQHHDWDLARREQLGKLADSEYATSGKSAGCPT